MKANKNTNSPLSSKLIRLGGLACLAFLAYTLFTLVLMVSAGPAPETAIECFGMLQGNPLVGLLRLDLLTVVCMPLYLLIFGGLFIALKDWKRLTALLGLVCICLGVVLFIANPSSLALLTLSQRYAQAAPAQQSIYLAAGEAILAGDLFHGTGSVLGRVFVLLGGLVFSALMMKNKLFGLWSGASGLLANGLDLVHLLWSWLIPGGGAVLLMIAGTFYLVWLPLTGFQMLRSANNPPEESAN